MKNYEVKMFTNVFKVQLRTLLKDKSIILFSIMFILIALVFSFISLTLNKLDYQSYKSIPLFTIMSFTFILLALFLLNIILTNSIIYKQNKNQLITIEIRSGLKLYNSIFARLLLEIFWNYVLITFVILVNLVITFTADNSNLYISLIMLPSVTLYFFAIIFISIIFFISTITQEVVAIILSVLIILSMIFSPFMNTIIIQNNKGIVKYDDLTLISNLNKKTKYSYSFYELLSENNINPVFLSDLNEGIGKMNEKIYHDSDWNNSSWLDLYNYSSLFETSNWIVAPGNSWNKELNQQMMITGNIYFNFAPDSSHNNMETIFGYSSLGKLISENLTLALEHKNEFIKISGNDEVHVDYFTNIDAKNNQKYDFYNFLESLSSFSNDQTFIDILEFISTNYEFIKFESLNLIETSKYSLENSDNLFMRKNYFNSYSDEIIIDYNPDPSSNFSNGKYPEATLDPTVLENNIELNSIYKTIPGVAILNNILINSFKSVYYFGMEDLNKYDKIINNLSSNNKVNALDHFYKIYSNGLTKNNITNLFATYPGVVGATPSNTVFKFTNKDFIELQNNEENSKVLWDNNATEIEKNFMPELASLIYGITWFTIMIGGVYLFNKRYFNV